MPLYEFALASGWDVPDVDLDNIEEIVPATDRAFVVPDAFATYSPGNTKVRLDGQDIITGKPSAIWLFPGITRLQWQHLWAMRGKVTVRTMNDDFEFARYNAIMKVPTLREINASRRMGPYEGGAFEDIEVLFRRLVAL